jgi:hypothetical protein
MWFRTVATLILLCCVCGSASASAYMYCWEPSLALNPAEQSFYKTISALQADALQAANPARSPKLVAFVTDLLARYPDLTDTEDTVWADGPLVNDITGGVINMSLIWTRYQEAAPFVVATAHKHGLNCFDPQTGEFTQHDATKRISPAGRRGIYVCIRSFGRSWDKPSCTRLKLHRNL